MRFAASVLGIFVLLGCNPQPAEKSDTALQSKAAPAPASDSLIGRASELVSFLSGKASFNPALIADSVTLYVAPEGGGDSARLSRDRLRDPAQWVVRRGPRTIVMTPPPALTTLTTRFGQHINCREYPLSSRFPELAKFPHVGTRLEPEVSASCLNTWNMTFVFDSVGTPPRLVAAVYDQWEW